MKLLKGKIVTELPLTGIVAGASYYLDKQDSTHFEHYVADDTLQLRKVQDLDHKGVMLLTSSDDSVDVSTSDGGSTYNIKLKPSDSIQSLVQGENININNTDPKNPVISAVIPEFEISGEEGIRVNGNVTYGFTVATDAVKKVEVEGGDIQARIENGVLKMSSSVTEPFVVHGSLQKGIPETEISQNGVRFDKSFFTAERDFDGLAKISINSDSIKEGETRTTFEVVSSQMNIDGQTFDIQMKYVGESGEDQFGEIKVPVYQLPEHLTRLTPEIMTFIETIKGEYEGNIGTWVTGP